MSTEIKGTIKVLTPIIEVSEKFKKREIVVTTNETYPQDISVQFSQAKCDLLNGYLIGQDVNISYNLRGNEYNGKYYVQLDGWKIEAVGNVTTPDAF
jgi:hypothetical protein